MLKYETPGEFEVESLVIGYEGRRYAGIGILHWDPTSGFQLKARMKLRSGPVPERVDFTAGPILLPRASFRMRTGALGRGVARTPLHLSQVNDFLGRAFWLTTPLDRVRFVRTREATASHACFADYDYSDKGPLLPEPVFTTRRLGAEGSPLESWRRAGIRAVVLDEKLEGFTDGGTLRLSWSVPSGRVRECRHWTAAVETALTALSTRPVQLLQYEAVAGSRWEREVRKKQEFRPIISEGLLGPRGIVNPGEFARLVEVLVAPGRKSRVVTRIVWGVMNAFQHRHGAAVDLEVASTLEGALRTLQGNRKKNWRVRSGLEWFEESFGLADLSGVHKQARSAFGYLRQRQAHPFWADDRRREREDANRALRSRNFLIRYYGLMIRAIAGLPLGEFRATLD